MDNETLNVILVSVVVPVLIALSAFIVRWLEKTTAEIKKHAESKQLLDYIRIAEDAVCRSVVAVTQTYVDAIKSEKGMLTQEEQETAFKLAKNKTLAILSIAAKEAITEVYQDLYVWLDDTVEFYVHNGK